MSNSNYILNAGICICTISPMGHSGMEGFDEHIQYKYEHMSNDTKHGKDYYRVYHDETYYETCGPGDFKAHFKIKKNDQKQSNSDTGVDEKS